MRLSSKKTSRPILGLKIGTESQCFSCSYARKNHLTNRQDYNREKALLRILILKTYREHLQNGSNRKCWDLNDQFNDPEN